MPIRRKPAFDRRITARALFYLGIHMLNHFLENEINLRPPFMIQTGRVSKILAADSADMRFRRNRSN
ncbi:MAG: hypothetical protein KZQ89_03760 [Candidatus Thiodiazotropha sp. (ex Lucinoma kastoroae)]|nr:hypothetical protein [Candidatus Thiodiazotropha sp. (ex Lucinoma kastoroae)]